MKALPWVAPASLFVAGGHTPLRPCSASGTLNRLRAASGGTPPGFVNPLFERLSTWCLGERRNPFRILYCSRQYLFVTDDLRTLTS